MDRTLNTALQQRRPRATRDQQLDDAERRVSIPIDLHLVRRHTDFET
jgi:hypothetical protein